MSTDFLNPSEGVEQQSDKDTFGGSVLPSGLYPMVCTLAYSNKVASGAVAFVTVWENKKAGTKVTDTQYVTSGDAKGNKNYYEKDGKRYEMPGLAHVRNMVEFIVGKQLRELTREDKSIPLYSSKEQKEVPTPVTVYPDLRGIKAELGILEVRENKKDAKNNYALLPEERRYNEVTKFFEFGTRLTATEKTAGKTAGEWVDQWLERNEGQVKDLYKEVAATGGAQSGSPMANNTANATVNDDELFNDLDL